MPSVLSLPNKPFPSTATPATSKHQLQLSSPTTPALIADDELEPEFDGDEWEHVGMLDDGEIVVVGELELEQEQEESQVKAQSAHKPSYAAVAVAGV